MAPSALSPAPLAVQAAGTPSAAANAAPPPSGRRLYALTRFVWIRPDPDARKPWIGYLTTGGSVALRDGEPVKGAGCDRFYPIEPLGWICVDERRATVDPSHPAIAKLAPYAPRTERAYPYRYGESVGLRRFDRLPTQAEAEALYPKTREQMLLRDMARTGQVPEKLRGIDFSDAPVTPLSLPELAPGTHEPYLDVPTESTVAWSAETFAEGRSWLLTYDLSFVPKDRVKPYAESSFQGLELGKDAKLPLAFFRSHPRPRYTLDGEGHPSVAAGEYPRHGWVELTGRELTYQGESFLETRDGHWVNKKHAVLPTPSPKDPWGDPVDVEAGKAPQGARRTWIEVSIYGGWLLAYEGHRPVYATLVSPGLGGVAPSTKSSKLDSTTPTGRFAITGKFVTATMWGGSEALHAEVPWTQNFDGPYAIHSAYWHSEWGSLRSAGCVNVSPRDGRWLFEFTEPRVPKGWHAVRWVPNESPATVVRIHP